MYLEYLDSTALQMYKLAGLLDLMQSRVRLFMFDLHSSRRARALSLSLSLQPTTTRSITQNKKEERLKSQSCMMLRGLFNPHAIQALARRACLRPSENWQCDAVRSVSTVSKVLVGIAAARLTKKTHDWPKMASVRGIVEDPAAADTSMTSHDVNSKAIEREYVRSVRRCDILRHKSSTDRQSHALLLLRNRRDRRLWLTTAMPPAHLHD